MVATRYALLTIGINYKGQAGELGGCVNDSQHLLRYFRARLGPQLRLVRQMVDTVPKSSPTYPSKANLEKALLDLVAMCRRGKVRDVIVHYSGHGAQQRDAGADEADGLDEVLVPADHAQAGTITDDWLRSKVTEALPAHASAFFLMDCCHSGTILDLKHRLEPASSGGGLRRTDNLTQGQQPKAHVVSLSGCRDAQYSADAWDAKYKASGAMTVSFLRVMQGKRGIVPLAHLLREMRDYLRSHGYDQVPELMASHPNGRLRVFPLRKG